MTLALAQRWHRSGERKSRRLRYVSLTEGYGELLERTERTERTESSGSLRGSSPREVDLRPNQEHLTRMLRAGSFSSSSSRGERPTKDSCCGRGLARALPCCPAAASRSGSALSRGLAGSLRMARSSRLVDQLLAACAAACPCAPWLEQGLPWREGPFRRDWSKESNQTEESLRSRQGSGLSLQSLELRDVGMAAVPEAEVLEAPPPVARSRTAPGYLDGRPPPAARARGEGEARAAQGEDAVPRRDVDLGVDDGVDDDDDDGAESEPERRTPRWLDDIDDDSGAESEPERIVPPEDLVEELAARQGPAAPGAAQGSPTGWLHSALASVLPHLSVLPHRS